MYSVATFIEYREIYDRPTTLAEIISRIEGLDPVASVGLLCEVNTQLRLIPREREVSAKLQQEIASEMLSEETIARLKARFGTAHMSDRPLFYSAQLTNLMQLIIEHSRGTANPTIDRSVRDTLGDACLMVNDLMVTAKERDSLKSADADDVRRALMVQSAATFEFQNAVPLHHIAYRTQIMFQDLLKKPDIRRKIGKKHAGFDFENEFVRAAGISISQWVSLMVGICSYHLHYLDPAGGWRRNYALIDRSVFANGTPIPTGDLDSAMRTVSMSLENLRGELKSPARRDWRFDSFPLRNKPLIELAHGKFVCSDLGLMREKIHSGIYWTIYDNLNDAGREALAGAWGRLFEEYVNWFLSGRSFRGTSFWPNPKFENGKEAFDGAFLKGSVFMPLEYKGRFVGRSTRYSGNERLLIRELNSKIAKGCGQLARNIELLFARNPHSRRMLLELPLEHVSRIVPVLVVQDNFLNGPLINWWVNKQFQSILRPELLRHDLKVDTLNLVGIGDLETMVESQEQGTFDFFSALQLRCYNDPEMTTCLHNFLLKLPGYGEGKSERVESAIKKQFDEAATYLFGKSLGAVGTTREDPPGQ